MKAATYIRVSTKEQNFDGQVDRIQKYLEGTWNNTSGKL
jgi:DNA invertase Pin-like site-specific DNA recombinase